MEENFLIKILALAIRKTSFRFLGNCIEGCNQKLSFLCSKRNEEEIQLFPVFISNFPRSGFVLVALHTQKKQIYLFRINFFGSKVNPRAFRFISFRFVSFLTQWYTPISKTVFTLLIMKVIIAIIIISLSLRSHLEATTCHSKLIVHRFTVEKISSCPLIWKQYILITELPF